MVEGSFHCPNCDRWLVEYFNDSGISLDCDECGSSLEINEFSLEVDIHEVKLIKKRNDHLEEEK